MKIVLLNPPLIGQVNNPLGQVPFQPVGLLYIASSLRAAGVEVELVDCFGESPQTYYHLEGGIAIHGLWGQSLLDRIPADADLIGVSCLFVVQHSVVQALIRDLKRERQAPVVIGGDHASLVAHEFIEAGADFVVRGEGERTTLALLEALGQPENLRKIPGLVGRDFDNGPAEFIADLDALPFPAYDLIRLDNYWNFGDAHGPMVGPYLELITSRGCPYDCDFCAGPALYRRRWRSRSAENVVAEMEHFYRTLGVSDFQIEDPNYSVNRERVRAIAEIILERNLPITYSLPSGIKVETIQAEDLDLMAASGLHYLTLAPESGSERVLNLMNKKMDFDHLRKIVERAQILGLPSAASFMLGYPGEEDEDRQKTLDLVLDLVRRGLDEFVLFIWCPSPGSKASRYLQLPSYNDASTSPTWRTDYPELERWRRRIYLQVSLTKLWRHPLKIFRNLWNILTGRARLKGEMVIRRAIRLRLANFLHSRRPRRLGPPRSSP